MFNIICRNKTWHFSRRVPVEFKEYDSREKVRISLKTDCKKEAVRLAGIENTRLLHYWNELLETRQKHSHDTYVQTYNRANILGFPYMSKAELACGDLSELADRILFVLNSKINEKQAQAVLGTVHMPQVLLSDLLPKFLEITKEIKLDKSDQQYRKWLNPRILAMKNLINVVSDKPINELTRQDMENVKDWWFDRIENEGLSKGTANTNLVYAKNIIEKTCKRLKVKIDKQHLFEDLFFKRNDKKQRLPFDTQYIRDTLLNEQNLKGLSDHYRKMMWVFAETGVHIDEQVAVRPENIFLSHCIPHIVIKSHEKDKLKTVHRERVMPLTGFALDAFKAYPKGFSNIVRNTDSASTAIGKYLRENNLLPSPQHTLYSLRHSFQDRLTNAGCLDRIQTDLMGHAFSERTKYGQGATLETALSWMKRIQLKPE